MNPREFQQLQQRVAMLERANALLTQPKSVARVITPITPSSFWRTSEFTWTSGIGHDYGDIWTKEWEEGSHSIDKGGGSDLVSSSAGKFLTVIGWCFTRESGSVSFGSTDKLEWELFTPNYVPSFLTSSYQVQVGSATPAAWDGAKALINEYHFGNYQFASSVASGSIFTLEMPGLIVKKTNGTTHTTISVKGYLTAHFIKVS